MAATHRPPVVTIMGHVDHGKTSLLDYIRKSHVTAKEAGGITQHIGAYQVNFDGKPITFIDTPGHAAFTKMRQRGAQVTDIVVLVVAANDGVKPQTIESIRHIKESTVSVIVAINKIDLPDVYPDNVKAQLAEQGILVQGFGGDIEVVEVSALKGTGVEKLLETIVLTAEINNYQADPEAPLQAVVIESAKDPQRGPVATALVQQGTISVRQDIASDDVMGRVRQLVTDTGASISSATPGMPVEVIGLKAVPSVGSIIYDPARPPEVVEPETVAADTETVPAEVAAPADEGPDFSDFDFSSLSEEVTQINLIVRADVEGTLEAIVNSLTDDSVKLISAAVGEVTEGDVELAESTRSAIIVFHTKVSNKVKQMAKAAGVKIKQYDVIYQLIEDLQQQMLKLLEPTIDEVVTGEAEILQVFEMRGERIAGIRVKTGEFKKSDLFHLKRGDEIIANPVIKSMMHGKQEIDQVKTKNEAGLTFKNKKLDFVVGDVLVAYKLLDA